MDPVDSHGVLPVVTGAQLDGYHVELDPAVDLWLQLLTPVTHWSAAKMNETWRTG